MISIKSRKRRAKKKPKTPPPRGAPVINPRTLFHIRNIRIEIFFVKKRKQKRTRRGKYVLRYQIDYNCAYTVGGKTKTPVIVQSRKKFFFPITVEVKLDRGLFVRTVTRVIIRRACLHEFLPTVIARFISCRLFSSSPPVGA